MRNIRPRFPPGRRRRPPTRPVDFDTAGNYACSVDVSGSLFYRFTVEDLAWVAPWTGIHRLKQALLGL